MHKRTRLSTSVWWGIAIVAIGLTAFVAGTSLENRHRTLAEASRDAQNSAALLAEQLTSLVSGTETVLALIERRGLSGTGALGRRYVDVDGLLDEMSDYAAGGLFTRHGLVKPVVSNGDVPEIPQEVVDDLMDGVTGAHRIWISRPFQSGHQLMVLFGRRPRAFAGDGAEIAVAVTMPLGRLTKLVSEPDVGEHGLVGLLRTDGLVLTRWPWRGREVGAFMPQFDLFEQIRTQGPAGSYVTHFTTDGTHRLANFRVIKGTPLVVNVARSHDEALATWRKDTFRDALLLAVTFLLLYLAGALIARVSRHREEAEADLREKTLLLGTTLNHMDQGLILIDADRRVPLYNQRALELLELPESLLAKRPHSDEITAFQVARGEYAHLEPSLRARLEGPAYWMPRTTFERERPNGKVIEVRSVPLPDGGTVRTFTDITDRKRAEKEIVRLAHRDVLTGLANRASFLDRLRRACRDLGEGEGEGFALVCLDLDRFKHVNDTLGHPVGDLLLREVADRLRGLTGENEMAARLGGDEFAVLLFGRPDQASVDAFAARVVCELNKPYHLDMAMPEVSVSGGTALAPWDGREPESLLRRADLALYEAKAAGRCIVRPFAPVMEQKAQRRRLLLRDLGEAIGGGQLRLEYQPIFDIEKRNVRGLEALIRWDHPARGPISPADFIPLAEESDLIDRIGEWVLREACRETASWGGSECVAVNVSAMQFVRGGLVPAVHGGLEAAGLAPHRLHLEITETALLRECDETIATLRELRATGVRIVLDDFGTGYSSLSHLCSFPFDRIKIDRSFTRGAARQRNSRAVVDAVAALGHELGIPTTAEGVETEAQLAVVRAAGCSEIQGFLYARPMRPEAVRTFLSECREQAA